MKLEGVHKIMKPDSGHKAIAIVEPASIEEQIRNRAYELFEARGREEGRELEDWLRAEQEITGHKSGDVAA